ncbi:MAG TPA: type II secretion system protein [Candidatus Dojkabacteria bacterium]|nr:type II secretion system protein [Candidatus Dojkabacteria bacterium]HRO65798.1 type II secretion system protein [Candidatus Dojkabacteria bacterium]HRP36816.1 type II secretion system protein [Candidatus Dojkabacteria bacterium]HRP51604.1 type II secretion system protein [Candidatus Dojkabacteria bacterium]
MKAKKAFTLLELLVAMAIIAVLIALAIFGIIQVQRNSRETQRRKAAEDINIGIQDYYTNYGEYPDVLTFGTISTGVGVEVSDSTGANVIEVPLKNAAEPGATTTAQATKWYFSNTAPGYKLNYCNERDVEIFAGTDETSGMTCP